MTKNDDSGRSGTPEITKKDPPGQPTPPNHRKCHFWTPRDSQEPPKCHFWTPRIVFFGHSGPQILKFDPPGTPDSLILAIPGGSSPEIIGFSRKGRIYVGGDREKHHIWQILAIPGGSSPEIIDFFTFRPPNSLLDPPNHVLDDLSLPKWESCHFSVRKGSPPFQNSLCARHIRPSFGPDVPPA